MKQDVLLTSISLDELKNALRECIKSELNQSMPPKPPKPEDDLITENQARDFLHVSKVTLKKWRDENKIPFYRIGSRIRYKKSEILTSLNTVRKYGRMDKK